MADSLKTSVTGHPSTLASDKLPPAAITSINNTFYCPHAQNSSGLPLACPRNTENETLAWAPYEDPNASQVQTC
ncbi:hypothetical protein Y1Q_0016353 [Alligator mississippiensis]|uniref:Uncharacterized protein n=1 Tax=Alligator mississippiensis TaxID=8496 RepID=A0A151N2A1_ALLMI|nr:hypothetical protein Y1Q_0016353 [Alligator mississippiensis]